MEIAKQFSLHSIAEDYVRYMVSQSPGMKSIIFDPETKVIFSLITSKSFAIKEEIFMFEELNKLKTEEKYPNIKGLFFLRPTDYNIDLLAKLLKQPNFYDISLYFTNTVNDDYLKKIAQSDEHGVIKNVQEVFLDYYIINSSLFHLDMNTSSLVKNIGLWKSQDHMMVERIVQSLIAMCYSTRLNPTIKIVKGNDLLALVAQKLISHFQEYSDFFLRSCGKEQNGILLLYDRKEDPVTPLLTQWTYQAMIHEIFYIHQNLCAVDKGKERVVLSDHEDNFFKENTDKVFADVASKIREKIEELGRSKDHEEMESFEEIKKYIESLPAKKKESMEITKHTAIIYELTNTLESRRLLELSSIEQDIACKDDKKDQLNRVIAFIKNSESRNQIDKIKLYLLFCLRYEQDTNSISTLKQILQDIGLGDYACLSDYLFSYAGQSKRTCDLLNNKDFISNTFSKFTQAFKDVPNIFTQHTSYLLNIIKKLHLKSKITELETVNPVKTEKSNKIVAFVVGGVTFEEARDANSFASSNKIQVILGGTSIPNSKEFVDFLTELGNNARK